VDPHQNFVDPHHWLFVNYNGKFSTSVFAPQDVVLTAGLGLVTLQIYIGVTNANEKY
jgi:hypothetical protein